MIQFLVLCACKGKEVNMTSLVTWKRFGAAVAVVGLLLLSVAPTLAQVIEFGRVLAFDTDQWTVWTPEGMTRVEVRGDGDTDLDCFVKDRFGNFLGSDTDYTDHCIVWVYNASSGDLIIEIENLGDVYNAYRLSVR